MRHLFFIFLCGYQTLCFPQAGANIGVNLSSVALLDIEPKGGIINLKFEQPSEAGKALQNIESNDTKWLNFTSALPLGSSRQISVQITSGGIPSGYGIILETFSFTGVGAGILGNNTPSVNLSNSPIRIIDNIGGAFTGDGLNNGYKLKFSLIVNDYSLLKNGRNVYSIIFTLTDN
jgi:hypothetical protein